VCLIYALAVAGVRFQAAARRAETELADQEARLRKVQAAHAMQLENLRAELQVRACMARDRCALCRRVRVRLARETCGVG